MDRKRTLWAFAGKGIFRQLCSPDAGYSGIPEGTNRPAITGLIDHISWGIESWDIAKVKADLEKRGLNPRPDMNGKFQSFHVHDPDGWDLQISNQTDTSEL